MVMLVHLKIIMLALQSWFLVCAYISTSLSPPSLLPSSLLLPSPASSLLPPPPSSSSLLFSLFFSHTLVISFLSLFFLFSSLTFDTVDPHSA
jgi:hypothetical protein